jgi:hypothetical protein
MVYPKIGQATMWGDDGKKLLLARACPLGGRQPNRGLTAATDL